MKTFEKQLSEAGLGAKIFTERQVADLLGGSPARRYGVINRALKDGTLVRLKRGTYALGPLYLKEPIHPFAVAQALVPGSYVSFETALAYHGWIPEAVFVTASVTPGRKTTHFDVSNFGTFDFHPLALEDYCFLVGVDRTTFGQLTALVAQPLRALMDLVALRKVQWSGLGWVTGGLRIDESMLLQLKRKDFVALRPVYKHQATKRFLHELESSMTKSLWDGAK